MKRKLFTLTLSLFVCSPVFASSRPAFFEPSQSNVTTTPIISVGEKAQNGHTFVGVPDGLGAIDNNDNTFSVFMHHEYDFYKGRRRTHGQRGAFISKWTITKPGHPAGDLKVLSGEDAIHTVHAWDKTARDLRIKDTALSRLCSADLAQPTAFFDSASNTGTQERIFLGGEESDMAKKRYYGRAFATVVTGPEEGHAYELVRFGDLAFENVVASPFEQNKTVVISLDDSVSNSPDTLGEIYIYVGNKQNHGTVVDRAGLTNGDLYALKVVGLPTEDFDHGLGNGINDRRFELAALGDMSKDDGKELFDKTKANNSLGITKFLRPEDGVWHQSQGGVFYFTTTGAGFGGQIGPARVWKLKFDDIQNPLAGGEITMPIDGTEGAFHLDNMTIAPDGKLYLQEDGGEGAHLSRIWQYNPSNDQLKEIAKANDNLFLSSSPNFITTNEESSGIIDVSHILGAGYFLASGQSHLHLSGLFSDWDNRKKLGLSFCEGHAAVQDGQLFLIHIQ